MNGSVEIQVNIVILQPLCLKRSGSLVSDNQCFVLTKLDDGVCQVKLKIYDIWNRSWPS